MSRASKIIITLLVVIIALGAGGLIWAISSGNNDDDNDTNVTQNNNSSDKNQNQNTDQTKDQAAVDKVTITYNGSSFKLSANVIQAGGTVTVVNASQSDLEFVSDPHPTHTDNPELNAGEIPAGENKSFVLTNVGTWGFHNHLNSTQRGSIEVR